MHEPNCVEFCKSQVPLSWYVSLVGWEPLHFQAKFQRRVNNHHIQIAELAQVFWSFFSVQKCHAKGQKLKLFNIKVWKMVSVLSFVRYEPSLLRTFNCWDAFLHKLLYFDQILTDNLRYRFPIVLQFLHMTVYYFEFEQMDFLQRFFSLLPRPETYQDLPASCYL